MRSSLASVLFVLAACSETTPARHPLSGDTVPANSLDEARLHGTNASPATDASNDPTRPNMTKVGEAPAAEASRGPPPRAPSRTSSSKGAAGGVASRAECSQMMDRYLELEIATNPQLNDLPPEAIAQAKQVGREKHGEAPCTASRAQYTCAMGAGSLAAWQRCVK